MSRFPTEVCGHVPPLPRIDLYPMRKGPAKPVEAPRSISAAECERIWMITRQIAEGTCAPIAPAPTETGIPATVDMSGWEVA